jgi:hypothetical protein
MSIKVICAWCQKDMGEKSGTCRDGISHGICPDCLEKVRNEMYQRKAEKSAAVCEPATRKPAYIF